MTTATPNLSDREKLENRLHELQSGLCYICDEPIDLDIHRGNLQIDHIVPKSKGGPDTENNYALTHDICNLLKSDSDLRVARCLALLDKMRTQARASGERGANLAHVLERYGGGKATLRAKRIGETMQVGYPEAGDTQIYSTLIYKDELSGDDYFFAYVPIEYIHHDDIINPRDIGSSIRGLLNEFIQGRPQLHVGLAHWMDDGSGGGLLKMFDGQHKAAAQIMLGTRKLPVRVFMNPNREVLTTTNTNAGSTLRQVAFDRATMRHLGHTQYLDRISQYRTDYNLQPDDLSFSESDLTSHFQGERNKVVGHIIDALRDSITHDPDNRLTDFMEMGGRSTARPLAYATVDSAFYQLLYKRVLSSPMDEDADSNPRDLERSQMVQLMNIFADVFIAGHWDSEVGGNRLENRVTQGEDIPPYHLRAWRVTRQPVAHNIIRWVHLVIHHHFALNGQQVETDKLLQNRFPPKLWENLEAFLTNLSRLPCWTDTKMSATVFAANRTQTYWESVFKNGTAPDSLVVLAKGLNIVEMMRRY